MDQMLALVLPYLQDVRTLLVCSTLSQQSQQLVQHAVQLNLATLAKQLPSALRRYCPDGGRSAERQLLWLCSTAGHAALDNHDNACALLWTLGKWPPTLTAACSKQVLKHLDMTTRLLTHVAVRHQSLLAGVLMHCKLADVDCAITSLAFCVVGEDVHNEGSMFDQLKAVTPANFANALRILAASRNVRGGEQLLARVLKHDRDCVHLLHPTADDSAVQQDKTVGAPGMHVATADALSRQHHQQQSSVAALLTELLNIAVVSGNGQVVLMLCALPCANSLGGPRVWQLICTAASHLQNEHDSYQQPCTMASLCSLPAAQTLPAASIAAALHQGIRSNCWHRLQRLLQLPNAKQMSTQCLCGLIKAAAGADGRAHNLVGLLCRLAQGRRLDHRPVVELVKVFLNAGNRPDVFKHSSCMPSLDDSGLDWLDNLQPGDHLIGNDVLELLEFVTEKGLRCWEPVCWRPAALQIDDIPRLVRVLQAVSSSRYKTNRPSPLQQLVNNLPAVQQLGAADWCKVLHSAFSTRGRMPEGCVELPGVQQLDAGQVEELLRVCMTKSLYAEAPALLQLPAAKLMPADTVASLLQQLLQIDPECTWGVYCKELAALWGCLLKLPQAASLPVKAVQQLHDTAFELGFAGMAKALLAALPQQAEAVCAVTGGRFAQGLLVVVEGLRTLSDGDDFMVWAQEPSLQGIDAGSCAQLIVRLVVAAQFAEEAPTGRQAPQMLSQILGLLHAVVRVPACQHMQASDVVSIIRVCLGAVGQEQCMRACIPILKDAVSGPQPFSPGQFTHIRCKMHPQWRCLCRGRGALLVLLAVTSWPTAAHILPGMLVDLLSDASKASVCVPVWELLMHLPAAQQLLPAQLAAALSKLLSDHCAENEHDTRMARSRPKPAEPPLACDVSRVFAVLLQHPVGQQLSVGDVTALLVALVQRQCRDGVFDVAGQLLRHPAGQQLSGDTLAHLMQVTVWQEHDHVSLSLLCLQNPGAASMTVDSVYNLLELFGEQAWHGNVMHLLLCLPAAQQLSLCQIKSVLWQACQVGDLHTCEALCALPAAAAARDDPEVQVALSTAPLNVVNGRSYYRPHREQGWCTCLGCKPNQQQHA